MLDTLLHSLNISPLLLLVNGALFLVTLWIMSWLFWKPVMRHLDKRKADIAGAYRAVEDTRREMENLRSEYQSRLARIEQEARGRIQQTVREAQAQREGMLQQSRAQSEEIIRGGAESIEREKAETTREMHETLDKMALDALSRALGATPDPTQRRLVDEYIAQNVLRS
jgi:F-type H+-transporting ATPase subunit b